MAKSYSIADARSRLADILDEVAAGREVRLTRRGKLVAVVLSTERYDALRSERSDFGQAYRDFRGRHSVADIGVDRDFFTSLRDRRAARKVAL